MAITWDYLAGFTDGEGYIGQYGRGAKITWGQKDEKQLWAVKQFLEAQGLHPTWNKISPKPPLRPNAIFMLHLCRREDVVRTVEKLFPLLILKSPNCAKVLAWHKQHPPKKHFKPIDVDRLRQLVADGWSAKRIGQMFDCKEGRISNIARAAGIKLNCGGGNWIDGRQIPARTEEEAKLQHRAKERIAICSDCGSSCYRYFHRCRKCADKRRVGKPHDVLNGRWAMKYPRCVLCGTKDSKHVGKGHCSKCRQKERYNANMQTKRKAHRDS